MEQKELQKLLNKSYNQENWKKIVLDVFPNVSLLSTPKVFPINNPKIEKFSQLGNVRLQDGKNLALFELILNDSVNLSRNRVELNNEISKYIDQEQIHGVLSVFEQGNEDYRFTFSARSTEFDEQEGDFVSKKTDTKRFTYVLGKNESCRTAAERFHQLSKKKDDATIKAIQDAFSVEQVSIEFFDKYTKQFKKFWTYLASTNEYNILFDHSDKGKQELKIRDFTKKLLGRIVFLHFLQKKEWLGCKTGTKEWIDGDKRFMQNLYESFSHKEHFYSQALSKLFFEVLNKRREGDIFNIAGLKSNLNDTKVPYLNGGLFDTDKDISKKIDFPQEYFENLFNFFGEYNFTIDENDPNDHEIGIDPEMLGHIFENLLEDNKDKGTFYTPKAIVKYMCKESIIEYLKTSLNLTETNTYQQEAITELIRDNLAEHVSDYDMVAPIAQALFDVKVCDPAIGSGAFPMGILNTIYQAIDNLYYLQPDSVAPIWKISETEWQPHIVKKNIIQNSIYGVDIESGAVDIARLRFWLALVVDETEPLPLPNLDYKIMQGNSLLESFEGIDLSQIANASAYEAEYVSEQLNIFTGEAKKKVQVSLHFEDIEALMEQYFNASNSEEKKEIHKKIDEQVTNHIRFTLLEHRKEIETKAKKLQKDLTYKEAAAPTWQQKEKIRTESKNAKELIKLNKDLSLYTNKEIALSKLSTSNERPFFLWHLFFKDVFDEGGFDIVIGNPPYVDIKGLENNFVKKLFSLYTTTENRMNLYAVFIEQGLNLCNDKGVISYIIPNSILLNSSYNKIRKKLLGGMKKIVKLPDSIFENATVETITFLALNYKIEDAIQGAYYKKNDKIDFKNLHFRLFDRNDWEQDPNSKFNIFVSPEITATLKKIEKNKYPLKNYFDFCLGITPYDKYKGHSQDIIKNRKFHSHTKTDKNYVPLISGRNITQYKVSTEINEYLNYGPWLGAPRKKDFFINPRVIVRQIISGNPPRIYAGYTDVELYHTQIGFSILSNDKNLYSLKILVALLNSNVINFYHRFKFLDIEKNIFQKVLIENCKNLPIANVSDSVRIKIEDSVTNILEDIETQKNINILNLLFYKLFDLDFKDVLLIESEFSTRMSKEEYAALKIE